jgi:DNA-binding NtrC family response regulator
VLGVSSSAIHEVRSTGTVIGRDTGDVRLHDDRISRQHVRIESIASGWRLVDLGSRNGGFVDGRTFKSKDHAALRDGTVIRLGDSLLVFRTSPLADDLGSDEPAFPGVSPVAAAVRRRIAALAAAPGHALVLGETGTGKERVARAIAEPRKPHPFVIQNCGELSRELARSELFGHAQGAFSGASHSKSGLIDAAGDGVLFLDEVGELSLDVQVDLLRFLEDETYRPVGAQRLIHSGARVIAATNVNLDQAIDSGRFRRDLVARLRASNAPLELPPLRERREDIPQWTRLFLAEAGYPTTGQIWAAGALECLLLYPWLGNLRELRGVVRGVFTENPRLPCETERLPEQIYQHRNALRGEPAGPSHDDATPPHSEPTQAEVEDALRRSNGIMASAAKLLGIERTKLYRICRTLGISLEQHRGISRSLDED